MLVRSLAYMAVSSVEPPSRWMSEDEILAMGFKFVGVGVLIDRGANFIGAERISIGAHSRIDIGTLISASTGDVIVGRHVHISAGVKIISTCGITLEDFVSVSFDSLLFTATDDFKDGFLTNPTVPGQFRKVLHASIYLEKHALVGAGSIVFPGVRMGYGAAVAARTILRHSVKRGSLSGSVSGATRKLGERNADRLWTLENDLTCSCFDDTLEP